MKTPKPIRKTFEIILGILLLLGLDALLMASLYVGWALLSIGAGFAVWFFSDFTAGFETTIGCIIGGFILLKMCDLAELIDETKEQWKSKKKDDNSADAGKDSKPTDSTGAATPSGPAA